MLIYNLERIYRARGIERPFVFLTSKGFSESLAFKLKEGKITSMKLSTLERVCEALNCTPHDLLEWTPDSSSAMIKDHPLSILESKNKPPDMSSILHSIPLEKMKEIEKMIREKPEEEDQ